MSHNLQQIRYLADPFVTLRLSELVWLRDPAASAVEQIMHLSVYAAPVNSGARQ